VAVVGGAVSTASFSSAEDLGVGVCALEAAGWPYTARRQIRRAPRAYTRPDKAPLRAHPQRLDARKQRDTQTPSRHPPHREGYIETPSRPSPSRPSPSRLHLRTVLYHSTVLYVLHSTARPSCTLKHSTYPLTRPLSWRGTAGANGGARRATNKYRDRDGDRGRGAVRAWMCGWVQRGAGETGHTHAHAHTPQHG
jgi:hypothetical protein